MISTGLVRDMNPSTRGGSKSRAAMLICETVCKD